MSVIDNLSWELASVNVLITHAIVPLGEFRTITRCPFDSAIERLIVCKSILHL